MKPQRPEGATANSQEREPAQALEGCDQRFTHEILHHRQLAPPIRAFGSSAARAMQPKRIFNLQGSSTSLKENRTGHSTIAAGVR
jgi:hypothetical protein